MKNKFGIILLAVSCIFVVLSFVLPFVVPINVIKIINHFNSYTFSTILILLPAIIVAVFSWFIFFRKKENKIFPILAMIIILLPAAWFVYSTINQKDAIVIENKNPKNWEEYSAICDKIQTESNKWQCYRDVAVAKDDTSICENIKETQYSINKSICYEKIGENRQDLNLCDKAGSYYRHLCYMNIAAEKKDFSICNKDNELLGFEGDYENVGHQKIECYSGVYRKIFEDGGDVVTICGNLNEKEELGSECYLQAAFAKNDSAYCKKATWSSDECYKQLAETKKNILICDSISSEANKYLCYVSVNPASQDPSVCDRLGYYDYKKASCIRDIAVAKMDTNICDAIVGYQKTDCYKDVAEAKLDYSICGKIDDSFSAGADSKLFCYLSLAEKTKNMYICRQMTRGQPNCYVSVAKGKQDASMCDNIASVITFDTQEDLQETQDSCYDYVAEAKKDISICDKISDTKTRDSCYNSVVYNLLNNSNE